MFGGFIDFRKVYDRVDREKLWVCLERMGIGGQVASFLRAVYMDVSCEVKVREVCRSLSGWNGAYDKVVFSHHCCS